VAALALYDLRLMQPPLRSLVPDLVLMEILILGSLLLKADFLLSCVALFALVWIRQGVNYRRFAEAAALVAVPLLVAFALFRNPNESYGFARHLSEQYGRPGLLARLFLPVHPKAFVSGMGTVSVPLFLVALVVLGLRRRLSYLLLFTSWVFLTMGYWFMQPTDDARHYLPDAVPIAFAIGWLLTVLPGKRYVP